jgi:hypothetical protein
MKKSPLDSQQSTFLFNLYKALRKSPLTLHGKYRTFETAAVDMMPWQIEKISLNALVHIVQEGSATGLRRGHRMQRKERAAIMFDPATEMNIDDMLEFFFSNDKVTLITTSENASHGQSHWSEQVNVPQHILRGGSYSVYASIADIEWARSVLVQLKRWDATTPAAKAKRKIRGADEKSKSLL